MSAWRRRRDDSYDENDYDDEYYDDYYSDEYYGSAYDDPSDVPTEVFGRAGRRDNAAVRAVRALSGVVCGAIVVLTIVVIGAQYLSGDRGIPGPGVESVAAHVVAAIVAIAGQVSADRRRGSAVLPGSGVVFVTAVFLMFTQWWG